MKEKIDNKIDSLVGYVKLREGIHNESEIMDDTIIVPEERDTWNILYYLYLNDEIVYIGQSKNVNEYTELNRIKEHRKTKKFNRYKITIIPKELDLKICESYEILKHNPIENKGLPCNYSTILTALTVVGEGNILIEAYTNKLYNFNGNWYEN